MSKELQLLVPISLVKIELPTVIKNEPPESEIVESGIDDILDSSESEEKIIPDVKDIDIVYHPVCNDSIKSEILESKQHCESVETEVLIKAENSPFIKTENITQRNKTEVTSDKNVSKGTDQVVVEVQDLNGISARTRKASRKAKHPKKTNFAKCYKTVETTSWEKDKEKINFIKAPVILVKPHEYTSLAKDKHVCNHCQHAYNTLNSLKYHIKRMHREVATMYQCSYCLYKLKSKRNLQNHIIRKHKNTKDIQWFQCHLCEKKFRLKFDLTRHKKVHLNPSIYQCPYCLYKLKSKWSLQNHIIRKHKKTKDIQWFQCHLCEKKFKLKCHLIGHMKVHLKYKRMEDGLGLKRYDCDKCVYKTYLSTNLKRHKLIHLKPEEIQYFYCYHCSNKFKRKDYLKSHFFTQHFKNVNQGKRHLKKGRVKFNCYICNFMMRKRESIIKHIKKHSKVQNKSEINEGS